MKRSSRTADSTEFPSQIMRLGYFR
jgi:hypothetical protein